MSNVIAFALPRTLPHLMLDIGAAQREVAMWDLRFQADPDGFAERGEDYRLEAAETRLSDLKSEARKMVEAATGCKFDDLMEWVA